MISHFGEIQIAMDCALVEMVVNTTSTDHIGAFIMTKPLRHAIRANTRDVHRLVNRSIQQTHLVRIDVVHVLLVVRIHRLVSLES